MSPINYRLDQLRDAEKGLNNTTFSETIKKSYKTEINGIRQSLQELAGDLNAEVIPLFREMGNKQPLEDPKVIRQLKALGERIDKIETDILSAQSAVVMRTHRLFNHHPQNPGKPKPSLPPAPPPSPTDSSPGVTEEPTEL